VSKSFLLLSLLKITIEYPISARIFSFSSYGKLAAGAHVPHPYQNQNVDHKFQTAKLLSQTS
jgi:hypothetical protein